MKLIDIDPKIAHAQMQFRALEASARPVGLPEGALSKSPEAVFVRLCASMLTKDERVELLVGYAKMLKDNEYNVLIRGESGTGKSILAKILHGCHRKGDFISINASGFHENLFESELFGHVRGAYSGATCTRNGKLIAAKDGTLFLDEIGDLPLEQQAKVLTAIETRKFFPLGSDTEQTCNCRFVFATNKDLNAMVLDGRFRADLYHRISTIVLTIPPLSERLGDIELIANAINAGIGLHGQYVEPLTAEDHALLRESAGLLKNGNVRLIQAWLIRRHVLSITLEEAINL